MSNIDNQFIKIIKSKSNNKISFIEEVSFVLDINYDAAYRRINGKTKLSLEDSIKLSKHFKVSLNKLYLVDDDSKIVVRKTLEIVDFKSLEKYFNIVCENLRRVFKNDGAMYYSAKELPIFHLLYDTELLRFKIYVWLHILGKDRNSKKIAFKDFNIPESLILVILKAGELYRNVKIMEIWSSNIINTILNQIQYFYDANLLSYKSSLNILKELKTTITRIEETTHFGQRDISKAKFELYFNPLLNSNNNVLVKIPGYKVLYMSYSILRYYEIEDIDICNNMEKILKEQLFLSQQITQSGIKDIILFFKPLYKQINSLKKRITLLKQFPVDNF